MRSRVIFAAILLVCFFSAVSGYSFTALYAFGDSVSDTGRNPATPASSYYNGRYSNGSLWVEYLSAELGFPYNAANNFAVSGSVTGDLQSQIAGLTASPNLRSALFTVESGGNDFLDNSGLGMNDAAWNGVVSNAVVNFTNAFNTLYADGAREILVLNLFNIGDAPISSSLPANYRTFINSKAQLLNAQLGSAITTVMQHDTGLRVYVADNNRLSSNIISSPATYGFTVSSIGALDDSNLSDKSFTGPGANYVFWDTIHPTSKGHAAIAALAFQAVGVQLNVARSGTNYNLSMSNLYPGLPYTIQSSANFVTWSNYTTFTASNTNNALVVTNGGGKMSFFRVGY